MRKLITRVSRKEEIILKLLIGDDQKYGLQLIRESKGRLKRGTIYVTLYRLENKKLVKSKVEKRERYVSGMARRMYTITGLGKNTLKE